MVTGLVVYVGAEVLIFFEERMQLGGMVYAETFGSFLYLCLLMRKYIWMFYSFCGHLGIIISSFFAC